MKKSWILTVLPAFAPNFGSRCLQQSAIFLSPTIETDETEPRRPAVWHSCPINSHCEAGIQTTRHGVLFDICHCSRVEFSPSVTLSSFPFAQTPRLKYHLLLDCPHLRDHSGTLGTTVLERHVPFPAWISNALQASPAAEEHKMKGQHTCINIMLLLPYHSISKLFPFWAPHTAMKIKGSSWRSP